MSATLVAIERAIAHIEAHLFFERPSLAAIGDRVAALLAGAPDGAVAARVHAAEPWLRVTPTVVSFADGAPVEVAIAP